MGVISELTTGMPTGWWPMHTASLFWRERMAYLLPLPIINKYCCRNIWTVKYWASQPHELTWAFSGTSLPCLWIGDKSVFNTYTLTQCNLGMLLCASIYQDKLAMVRLEWLIKKKNQFRGKWKDGVQSVNSETKGKETEVKLSPLYCHSPYANIIHTGEWDCIAQGP